MEQSSAREQSSESEGGESSEESSESEESASSTSEESTTEGVSCGNRGSTDGGFRGDVGAPEENKTPAKEAKMLPPRISSGSGAIE